MGSNATINSSTESDIVTKWVDHELKKIKRNLSKEISYKESLPTGKSSAHINNFSVSLSVSLIAVEIKLLSDFPHVKHLSELDHPVV